jgi:hypothetical protein
MQIQIQKQNRSRDRRRIGRRLRSWRLLLPRRRRRSQKLLPSPFTKLLPAASSNCHSLLILLGLTTLAQTFNQPLTDKAAAAAYVASLSPLTKEQLVQAFSRALDEAKLLPVPALLRDFASIGDHAPGPGRVDRQTYCKALSLVLSTENRSFSPETATERDTVA